MKRFLLWLAVPVFAHAQFVAVDQGDKDKGFTRTEIHVDTMDRSFVPAITETKEKKLSDAKTQSVTVTQARLADGSYFAAQRASSVTEKVSPTEKRTVTQVSDTDRQGQTQTSRQVTEVVQQTPTGEQRVKTEATRNSSGLLVPEKQIMETITKKADGSSTAQRIEQERDVNGEMVPKREVQEQTTARGPNEQLITSSIQTYSHQTGQMAETAREQTVVRTTGQTTQSERLIQERVGTSWVLKGKVETKEVQTASGATERETVQYSKPLSTGERFSSEEPLKPALKIVEHAVPSADGTTRVQRDVYRRDVNNEWKAQSFSTDYKGTAQGASGQ